MKQPDHPPPSPPPCSNMDAGVCMQVQYERHAAQAAVAQTAKVQLRKETEWMRRQPKARSTKSKSRQEAFYTLSDTARSGPKLEAKADFGQGAMARQVSPQGARNVHPLCLCSLLHSFWQQQDPFHD